MKSMLGFPEILTLPKAAKLINVNKDYVRRWIATGQTPMGEIREREHFFMVGRQPRIVTRKWLEHFKIADVGEECK